MVKAAGHPLLSACIASALAFSLMFLGLMLVTGHLEGAPFRIGPAARLWLIAFGVSAAVQFCFGGLVYLALTKIGLFRWWSVLAIYLIPVAAFGFLAETTADLWGSLRWTVLTGVTALVFFKLAAPKWKPAAASG